MDFSPGYAVYVIGQVFVPLSSGVKISVSPRKYVPPRIITVTGLVRERFALSRRTASLALAIVAKGPSVFCLFGSGNLPDQELFPFVATKKVALGFLFD